MKKLFTVLLVTFISPLAFAQDSLHPCTPVVPAQNTYISCRDRDGRFFAITIETDMSPPIEMCRGKNYAENKTAMIEITDSAGRDVGDITLYNGNFEYELSTPTTFSSDAVSFQFEYCSTPLHGGVSLGN